MPQATFVLKEPNATEETLIYLIYRFTGLRLKYSIGQKINPRFWNSETQRARETVKFKGYREFNALLNNLDHTVDNAYRKLINDHITPTPDLLKSALNQFLKKDNGKAKDIITFSEYWVETTDRSKGTKKQLRQAIRNLKEYKQATKCSLHFDSITLDFYDSFMNFLVKKNYAKNTIGTLIKNVKVFMNEAVDRELTNNLQFKNKRFRTVEEPTENIYLTEKELERLYTLDLSLIQRLDKVRDLFIVACYTGLRFSDLMAVKKEHIIREGSCLRINTIKTGELVEIPLKGMVREILRKYDGTPPKGISNQKMNEYLKELGELAEIEEDVIITSTKGGKRQSETFKKWELITTHTARRSFSTNAYLKNMPTISIMKMTGHRSEKSFLKYIKISQEDNALKLNNHPFFI